MLKNISYNNKKITEEMNTLVGNPFPFLSRIKMGGIGSKRLVINKWSIHFENLLKYDRSINYCSVELRPKGVIIRFRSILETYAWAIPYYRLVFFHTAAGLSIHAEGLKLTVNRNYGDENEKSFISKLMRLKTEFMDAQQCELA